MERQESKDDEKKKEIMQKEKVNQTDKKKETKEQEKKGAMERQENKANKKKETENSIVVSGCSVQVQELCNLPAVKAAIAKDWSGDYY